MRDDSQYYNPPFRQRHPLITVPEVKPRHLRYPPAPKPLAGPAASAVHGRKLYKCPECSKVFTTDRGLRYHKPKHTGKFRFWCGQCQRDFPSRNNFKAHMDKHEGITYPCNRCNKRFGTARSLKYHQSEHTGVYLYTCRKCGKGYNGKSNFLRHQEFCHYETT